ncbi:hypothetical protein [Candidatus Symbiopectobacterium sp.]|uniref:hypothetical protein n=1 Tax=Candidatus Symbiopectobacterium sp. TaxID=2816440 RepID=UPI0025BA465E|nr:hypothetical protein [Candidatus Symbiopectobacterium sp.]
MVICSDDYPKVLFIQQSLITGIFNKARLFTFTFYFDRHHFRCRPVISRYFS